MNVFIAGLPMKIMVGIFPYHHYEYLRLGNDYPISQVFDNVDLLFRLLSNIVEYE